ncbi:hypothetical protein WDU94_002283 [Cyamophila willieti]
MCYTDCFLIYFTIRAGSACVSSILLMFGLVGVVLVPLLPYSSNEMQFFLIFGYMVLLVVAFSTALCGTLTDSKRTISIGLILGIIAFLVWMALTIPSIMVYLTSNNEFCLGQNCGESHWLVPRSWSEEEKTYKPTPPPQSRINLIPPQSRVDLISPDEEKISAFDVFTEARRLPSVNAITTEPDDSENYLDSDDDNVKNLELDRKLNDDDVASVVDMKQQARRIPVGESADGKRPYIEPAAGMYDDELADLADSILKSEHAVSKRDLMRLAETIINEKLDRPVFKRETDTVPERQLRAKPVNVNRFIAGGNSLIQLTRLWSTFLAAIYACLFCFVLTTIFMNLASYACREGELEDCEGYCPEGEGPTRTNSMMISNI